MGPRIVKQLAGALLAALVSSFVVFAMVYLAPGNPIKFLSGGRALAPAAVASIRAQYHLNDSFFERYWLWLSGAVHGNFGQSLISHVPVGQEVGPAVIVTLELVAGAALLMLTGGVVFGIVAGLRGGWVDTGIRTLLDIALAIPPFVVAIIAISLFAVKLGWLPVEGAGSGFGGRIEHLVLPSLALALGGLAYVARITRMSVIEEFGREHVETARARGLPEHTVVRRHVLRNAMIPISTVAGVTVAALIAGSVVIENAFGLGGLGSLLVSSVTEKDFAVVQAVALIFVIAFIVANTCIDLLYPVIDPRLRQSRS
jgi:peptide/nickel transport system permease protein